MKRRWGILLSLFIAAVLCVSMAACAGGGDPEDEEKTLETIIQESKDHYNDSSKVLKMTVVTTYNGEESGETYTYLNNLVKSEETSDGETVIGYYEKKTDGGYTLYAQEENGDFTARSVSNPASERSEALKVLNLVNDMKHMTVLANGKYSVKADQLTAFATVANNYFSGIAGCTEVYFTIAADKVSSLYALMEQDDDTFSISITLTYDAAAFSLPQVA